MRTSGLANLIWSSVHVLHYVYWLACLFSDMPGAMESLHVKWMLYQHWAAILQFSNAEREHPSHFASLGKESVIVCTMISVIRIRRNMDIQKVILKMMH